MSLEFWNGNYAVARAVQLARVKHIAAYPITPQTHTVEHLAEFVADGELDARLTKVESEHSALSACCGASVVGARTFTASCSQGLALMTEVLYFASGMRFPIVMAVANRTMSVPVNIWADHQDTLVLRDSGWLQLYATTVQEAHDMLLVAYRVAEDPAVCLPVIVAYDGFILSHASEPVEPISQQMADAFLPPPGPPGRPLMDVAKPQQFGEVLFPDYYPDHEYKKHQALAGALPVIEAAFAALAEQTGRRWSALEAHDCDGAEVVLVGIGSMMQTTLYTAEQLRADGVLVGVVIVRSFRPFPDAMLRAAVGEAPVVAVLDRNIGYGTTGMVYPDVLRALYSVPHRPKLLDFIIGTGGKDITPDSLKRCVELALQPGEQQVFWPDARGPAEGLPFNEGVQL